MERTPCSEIVASIVDIVLWKLYIAIHTPVTTSIVHTGIGKHVHCQMCAIHPGFPSTPMNLRSATDSVAVRLDWDPPQNDGGVAITNYLIFVNMSQQVVSTNTTTTLALNSTGQHLIEISAVNECGLEGDNVSIIIITGNDKIEQQIIIIITYLDFNVLLTTTSDGSSTSGMTLLSCA